MESTFNFNISLIFTEDDDLSLNITTDSDGIETIQQAAISMFFKEAMTAQTDTMAGLAIEYGKIAKSLQDERDNY